MIIDEIKIYSAAEKGISAQLFVTLGLENVSETQSYILEDVVGLDPDQVGPVYTGSYSGSDSTYSAKYYDVVSPPRTIGMRIKLNPNIANGETYSSLREALYKLIWKSRTALVEIHLRNNNVVSAMTKGFTTRFEAPLFTSDPYIAITFYCPNGLLTAQNYVTFTHANIYDTLDKYIITDNYSTAPHGFKMTLDVDYDIYSVTVQGLTGYDSYPFKINMDLDSGSKIYFSSETDNRYLYYTAPSSSTKVHIADKIDSNQVWPMLFPGQNNFSIQSVPHAELYGDLVPISSLSHKYAYWGV